ncbi:glandular kallikrein-3, submandibular-like [Brevipalpus obovatus]|uniref:glandular kallikrein-3, submandibular-like n=1 Tax=Brevipalpus obovatus TaxID=246614 RepID=UPI003D9EAF79
MDVTGWGQIKSGPNPEPKDFPDDLMVVRLKMNSDADCRKMFPYYVTPEMFCIGKKSKTTGTGDSGGPVVMKRVTTKEPVLIGIISGGRSDTLAGTICSNLTHFGSWIEKRINDEDPRYECKNVFPTP